MAGAQGAPVRPAGDDGPRRSEVDVLAVEFIGRRAALDPVWATYNGLAGFDDRLPDCSPAGWAAYADLCRETISGLRAAGESSPADARARRAITERLDLELERMAAGEHLRALAVIGSRHGALRGCFDLMPRESEGDWSQLAERLTGLPAALGGVQATFAEGVDRGLVAARRQALACAAQARVWAGSAAQPGYFTRLVAGYRGEDGVLAGRLQDAANAAGRAYARLADYLAGPYARAATEQDAVGGERYALAARVSTGAQLDLRETYDWGWAELHRIEAEMAATAAEVAPGATVAEAMAILDADESRVIYGAEHLRGWLQDLMDSTIEALDGRHFDLPGPVRRVEAMLAPPGGAAAMYYTRPSADFSRPGRTWYPVEGRTRFPTWVEVSTAYHEGVPGHHLQFATTAWIADSLNPMLAGPASVPGHTEGWALYAERLMHELGFLTDPGERLGMLAGQLFRAARVVVDIGLHLQLRLPAGQAFHPGERWSRELAVEFLLAGGRTEAFVRSEVDRYLGWPGQAISYKVGERVWLEVRERCRGADGGAFDLRQFHTRALSLGMLGLEAFAAAMAPVDDEATREPAAIDPGALASAPDPGLLP